MYCLGRQKIRVVIFSRGQNVLGTAVLGDKGKSLENLVLENSDKMLGTTILADKNNGRETTAFKPFEVEEFCARR
jgi:hypothetical protein